MVIIFNLVFFFFFFRPAECGRGESRTLAQVWGCAAMGDLLDGLALQYTAVGNEWFGHELALELEGSFF